MNAVLVIPALNPDTRLIELVNQIQQQGNFSVIIVDDGSRCDCQSIFYLLESAFHCFVLHHPENRGKGAALKTGIHYALKNFPDLTGIVTADADGQHLPADILQIAAALTAYPDRLILGIRNLSAENVPFKSHWGNKITSAVFKISSGVTCPDTQTGLRGIPAGIADFCLHIQGDRFEYEMNMLIAAAKNGIHMQMVPISTVYLENNHSSHFHVIRDSALIYFSILKFSISSLASALTDLTLFTLFTSMFFGRSASGIFVSTIFARCLSGGVNFTLNKRWCFKSRGNSRIQALKYFVLFCLQMFLSWSVVTLFSYLPVNLTLIKMLTDSGLFLISYFVQKKYIFKGISPDHQNRTVIL